jgi:hypothetical protein
MENLYGSLGLVLDFSDHQQVLTDACVLLCGHTGALKLLELGYIARSPYGPGWQPAKGRACTGNDPRAP